jgi:phage-related holin
MAAITAWLFGTLGPLLFLLLIIFIIGFVILIISKATVRKPKSPVVFVSWDSEY